MTGAYRPTIALARLYEKTSKRGAQYFTGRLGLAKLVLLKGEETAIRSGFCRFKSRPPRRQQSRRSGPLICSERRNACDRAKRTRIYRTRPSTICGARSWCHERRRPLRG